MSVQRIRHVDVAKGVGIILIVASHVWLETDDATSIESVIYEKWRILLHSFFISLFFVLSGIFESRRFEKETYVKRLLRLAKYIVVFWIWGILSYIVINHRLDLHAGATKYAGTVWFLYVLLLITTIWGSVKILPFLYQMIITTILGWGGYFLSYLEYNIPIIGQTLLCLPFFAIGYWTKDWLLIPSFRLKIMISSFFIWIMTAFLFHYRDQNIAFNTVGYDLICFYLTALSGSLFVIEACKLVNGNILSFIGRNSVVIMMVHFCLIYVNGVVLHISIDSWWLWILFVFSFVLVSIAFIPVFRNKYYKLL